MKIVNHELRVHSVTYISKEPAELAGFYQQALNIPVAEEIEKGHYVIELKNMSLSFEDGKEAPKSKEAGPMIWFYVEDVEETFTRMVGMGARVRTNVTKDLQPGQALAVFYDLDGNLFGLIGPSVPGGETV